MSDIIPPLVCNTPPPIDYDNDDDFGGFETSDGTFEHYDDENSLPPTPHKFKTITTNMHEELPVPSPIPPSPIYNDTIENMKISEKDNTASLDTLHVNSIPEIAISDAALSEDGISETNIRIELKDDINTYDNELFDENVNNISKNEQNIPRSDKMKPSIEAISSISINVAVEPEPDSEYDSYNRSESPPSLELAPQKYSDNECDINVNNDDDFEDFIDHQNYQQNKFLDINVNKSDDSTSLPSLNLDSMRNTPIFERTDDIEESRVDGDNEIKLNEIVNRSENENESKRYVSDSFNDTVEEYDECQSPNDNATNQIKVNDFDSHSNDEIKEELANEEFTENVATFDADFSQFNAFASDLSSEVVGKVSSNNKVESADSASFGNLDHNLNDDEFGDFEEATTEAKNAQDDFNDDDFGEFSDFQQQAPNETTISSSTSTVNTDVSQMNLQSIQTKLEPLLNKLFPVEETDSVSEEVANEYQNTKKLNQKQEFQTNIVQNLRDFENSNALTHQWSNSSGKSSLVKALGIDSRNILYGEKWNSSVPRFAANLSFNPLEPLKTTAVETSSTSINKSSDVNVSAATSVRSTTNIPISDVPAAQFDWNSSGLVNPLDGVQESNIQKTSISTENRPTWSDTDRKKPTTEVTTTAKSFYTTEPSLPSTSTESSFPNELNESISKIPNCLNEEQLSQTSASYSVSGGTLKETHIFTPNKLSTNPTGISTSITTETHKSSITSCSDFDYDKISAGIVINEKVVKKEYRDVEYDPSKLSASNALEAENFSDFQSVEPAKHPLQVNILEPIKVTEPSTSIKWSASNDFPESSGLDDVNSFSSKINDNEIRTTGKITVFNNSSRKSSKNLTEYSRPVIGISPTDTMFSSEPTKVDQNNQVNNDSEEFTEFQSIPAKNITQNFNISDVIPVNIPSSQNNKHEPNLQSSLPDVFQSMPKSLEASPLPNNVDSVSWQKLNGNLSTTDTLHSTSAVPFMGNNILVPQTVPQTQSNKEVDHKPVINWPEPGIDSDELARLESIFPQKNELPPLTNHVTSKSPTHVTSSNVNDDEWSDFVSVTQPQTPITNILNQNLQKQQSEDDDWSDFVSSTAPASNVDWNMKIGPNFTSWNAPPQFNSWQNSTLFQPSQSVSQSSFVSGFDSKPSSSLTTAPNYMNNGINYGNSSQLNSPQKNNGKLSVLSDLSQNSQQYQPSIISIPDLRFVAPKTLVNMPKNNFGKK